jgi:multicomponent Na+:H+ antiporter subunit G
MDWKDWITVVFLALGCFLDLTGAIGILRMPDFYTRLHPAGKSDTLAQLFIVVALLFQVDEFATDYWATFSKLVLIAIFMFLTTPLATHAITKAAHMAGLQPWTLSHPHEGRYIDLALGSEHGNWDKNEPPASSRDVVDLASESTNQSSSKSESQS